MSKASRLRRKAEEKKRARQQQARQQPGGSREQGARRPTGTRQTGTRQPPPDSARQAPAAEQAFSSERLAELAERLVAEAVSARFGDDTDRFDLAVAQLTETPGFPAWPRIADEALFRVLQRAVTRAWRQGWQPAEVVRQVSRAAGERHAGLAADLIAAESRDYPAATIDERWTAQLTALDAKIWWGTGRYLDRWRAREGLNRWRAITCALEVLCELHALPRLAQLCPPPGTATNRPPAAPAGTRQPAGQRMLEKVRALLAKAESTEFEAEADALTSRAQELMARHSIDAAMLAAASGATSAPSGRRLFVDNPYEGPKAILLNVIAKANRCRAVSHTSLGMCTVLGFPGDLDAVELLFTSLLVQATTTMLRAGTRRDRYGQSRTRAFRQSFLTSYADRIGERLDQAAGTAQQQAAAEPAGTNLLPVLAARHRAVDEATTEMFPNLTQSRGTRISDMEGWQQGRAAADLATLRRRHEVADTPA